MSAVDESKQFVVVSIERYESLIRASAKLSVLIRFITNSDYVSVDDINAILGIKRYCDETRQTKQNEREVLNDGNVAEE